MTEAEFRRSLRQTLPVLRDLGVLRPPMHFPRAPSESFKRISFSSSSSYADVFRTGLKHKDFSFLLQDFSYCHFFHYGDHQGWGVRYGYYPNPFPATDFDEFLEEFDILGSDPEAVEFYEQMMSEQPPKDGIGPFRYEVDFDGHRPLRHACAHLHTGHKSLVRLPVERVLTPRAFTLFIAKHHFPQAWSAPDEHGIPNRFDESLREERGVCDILPEVNFSSLERQEFFLT